MLAGADGGSYVDEMRVYARSSDGAFESSQWRTHPYDHGWEGRGNSVLHARVRDGSMKGRAWGDRRLAGPGRPYRCASDTVTFTAQR